MFERNQIRKHKCVVRENSTASKTLVSRFSPLLIHNYNDNLIIGLSIVKRFSNKSLPEDEQIHAYSG